MGFIITTGLGFKTTLSLDFAGLVSSTPRALVLESNEFVSSILLVNTIEKGFCPVPSKRVAPVDL